MTWGIQSVKIFIFLSAQSSCGTAAAQHTALQAARGMGTAHREHPRAPPLPIAFS